ncbi:MAG: hypothetical protein M9916_00905 [Crocinitomicaceae bacterium]|nr:hypothetical protein [Crocinitomicaceae bacterium]
MKNFKKVQSLETENSRRDKRLRREFKKREIERNKLFGTPIKKKKFKQLCVPIKSFFCVALVALAKRIFLKICFSK